MTDSPLDTAPPKLRNDLILHRGPAEADGSPTWTLYDPSGNRFFRIGWLEFECLSRFGAYKTIGEVAEAVGRETALEVTPEDIMEVARFLTLSELVVISGPDASNILEKKSRLQKKSFWKKILHSYLFFIVPLVNPDRFLRRTLPFVGPLYTKTFFRFLLVLLAFGLYLTAKRWDEFWNTFLNFFSWEGLAFYIVAIACVKMLHELSHAYMAARQGVRVSSMGVAFIVLYPVLFTETSGAWKLPERKGRLLIGGAGVLAELSVAAIALMLWHMVPDGPVRSTAFFLATVSLAGSLLINLNPFMRFDGYYLLGDALGVDNLQARAFALARWNMRRILFGWCDPVPETFERPLHLALLIYAYGTWIYRFFLFLGIAVLVYMLFFKPLGPFLMAVELIFFLGLPIYREMKSWWTMREKMNWNIRTGLSSAFLGIVILALIVPWRGQVDVPAVIQANDYRNLHAPAPARIDRLHVSQGQQVQKGALLLELTSLELDQKILAARQTLEALKRQKTREETDRKLVQRRHVVDRLIAQAQSTLAGYERQRQALKIHAPFDGRIADISPNLHKGRWVGEDLPLIRLVNFDRSILHGYIHEKDAGLVRIGNQGTFYPDNGGVLKLLRVKLTDMNQNNAASLDRADFSGLYGGPVAVQDHDGAGAAKGLLPRDTLYAATFVPLDSENLKAPPYLLRGHIRLKGKRESPLYRLFRHSAALLIRRSGF